MSTSIPPSAGFTETFFEIPYPVILWPNSNHFQATPGLAVGIEQCNFFGTKRLIVRYTAPVRRKVSGQLTTWPNDTVYVAERDVQGWRLDSNPN